MTDKEIIIDGVDVSECEKLGETIDGITCGLGKRIRFVNEIITKHNLCKNNPNCYYKQLKRKEQECERLKKELQAQRAFTAHEQKLISCVAYDESCKTGNDCKQKKYIFKDKIKLKQTLTEIKDICKTNVCKHCHSKLKIDDNYCKNIKDCDCYKILQKISKCEV